MAKLLQVKLCCLLLPAWSVRIDILQLDRYYVKGLWCILVWQSSCAGGSWG